MSPLSSALQCLLLWCLWTIGTALAQSPTPSTSQITQVATTVPWETVAGAPLQGAERVQLTERGIETRMTAQEADIFGFQNSTEENARRSLRATRRTCKVFPGDSDWPSDSDWHILDGFLGPNELEGEGAPRRLIPTVPVAASCYDTRWGRKDAEKCASVVGNFTDASFHLKDPTSIMWPIFQGRTCMPRSDTGNRTCTTGGYPEYAVKVEAVSHVQLAVNFARTTGLRLVIKNTGHCYLGKSSGAGALSLWMHHLKEIDFLPDYKGPGYSGPAMKLSAGVTVREVYEVADKHGVTVLGAISPSVGYAGGMITGGGQNPLAALYGMATDQVVAFGVVTADGRFITVSEESEPDLFWALRGGGGGTFAVVVSVIIRAYPKLDVVISSWVLDMATNSEEKYWAGVKKFYELFTDWTDAGFYSFYSHNQSSLYMRYVFAPNHTLETYAKVVQPFFNYLDENDIVLFSPPKTTAYSSFYSAYQAAWGSSPPPIGTDVSLPANRIVPRVNFERKFSETFALLKEHVSAGRHFLGFHNAPKNFANTDNAVHPAWRQCVLFLVTSSNRSMDISTPARLEAANKDLQENILDPWRKAAPVEEGGGTYLNEASVEEDDWMVSFYGGFYPRLSEIKKKWDPLDVFYATTAVGSERWEVRDGGQGVQTQNGRLCRV